MKFMRYTAIKTGFPGIALLCILLLCGCRQSQPAMSAAEFGEEGQQEGNLPSVQEETEKLQEEEQTEDLTEAQAEEVSYRARVKVKGIYVTGPVAGIERMDELIDLIDRTELNTVVMDIKNDEGRVVYKMQIPEVEETEAGIRYVRDMDALMEKCREKDIYMIARIVAFKDPFLVEKKPEWCVHNSDGSVFLDKDGLAWLNPYNREVWDYLLAIAREALQIGFDEIQFDYVRFSTDEGMENADFGEEAAEKDRQQIIAEFAQYAAEEIHKAGGIVSADVYGMVIDSEVDQKIVGQNYVEMAKYLDYISPMVYPSHYGAYNYNIPVPDAEPYRLVLTALQASGRVLAGLPKGGSVSGNEIPKNDEQESEERESEEQETEEQESEEQKTEEQKTEEQESEEQETTEQAVIYERPAPMDGIRAQVRPWLQDFTATWVKGHIPYEAKEIREQIQAVYDAGYDEWILWNASNRYTEEGLLPAEEAAGKDDM